MVTIGRRQFLSSGLAMGTMAVLEGCAGSSRDMPLVGSLFDTGSRTASGGETLSKPDYTAIYSSFGGERFPIDSFDFTKVDPVFLRQVVDYRGSETPGTIVVDPPARQMFFVEPGRRATRYGVGVGREGFAWSGTAKINMRRSWPDWIPPHEMVERDPDIQSRLEDTKRGKGVPGGPHSPLGARAMYLFGKTGDLGYRIHGTTEPETIGSNVSSGCVRMVNQDIIHLYSRAPEGTTVIVLG